MLAGCGPDENHAGLTGTRSHVSPLIADEGFWMGVYHPLNNVIMAEADGIQVVANGNLALSFADSNFEGTLDANNELDTFRANVGLDGALTVDVAVEGSGALDSALDLATIPLPPINVSAVVTVTPYVQMRLLLSGTAAATARVSVVAPFHVGAAFSKASRRRTDLSSEPQFTAEVGLPEVSGNFDGTVSLEVTTTFLVAIQGFEVGGPVVGTRLGAHLQVDVAAATWTLDSLVSIIGGWAFRDPTTGLPDVPEEDLLEREFPPRHLADGSIPELGPATRWSRVFDVERDDNAATALLAGEEMVVVESGDHPWLASLGPLGAPSWQSTAADHWVPKAMARAQDGDLLVAGVSTDGRDMRVERYDPSGTPRWRSVLTVAGAEVTFNAILATSGNDTITVGVVEYDDGTSRPIVAALDALGNLQWSKEIDTGAGSTNAVIEALAETPSGGFSPSAGSPMPIPAPPSTAQTRWSCISTSKATRERPTPWAEPARRLRATWPCTRMAPTPSPASRMSSLLTSPGSHRCGPTIACAGRRRTRAGPTSTATVNRPS